MFFNEYAVKNASTDEVAPYHYLFNFEGANYTIWPLITLAVYLVGVSILYCFNSEKLFSHLYLDIKKDVLYWKSIEGMKQKELYTVEVYRRKRLNIKSMEDESLEMLRTS